MPVQSVAASTERAAEHWFTECPLIEAVLASCAVPGRLPPVEIGEEHVLGGASPARPGIGAACRAPARYLSQPAHATG